MKVNPPQTPHPSQPATVITPILHPQTNQPTLPGVRGRDVDDDAATVDESSDDGEEAAKILKKTQFPDIEKEKKPSEACTKVCACLSKRTGKLQMHQKTLGNLKARTSQQEANGA